jgi:hypothetical protein
LTATGFCGSRECRLLAHFDVRDAATLCLKLRDKRTRPARHASSQFGPSSDLAARPHRVERSLYHRAVGYNYKAVKIFMPANRSKPVYAPYIEHVPPDVTAGIFWMKNRDPQHWRDSQQLEHVLGKYIISDKPMTEEEWARERADVLDVEEQPLLLKEASRFP